MNAAEYLTKWKQQNRLSDEAAARWLHISPSAFRRQRKGRVVRAAQSVFLAELYPIYTVGWLDIAVTARQLGVLLSPAPSRGHDGPAG